MSFFRNIRSSLASATSSRKSSSRDTTPVRSCNSRPASVISSRRDSSTSSTLQRGDTFILNDEEEEPQQRPTESNSSTLEKKSKKSKVFSKFSTFTKRKKTPSPEEVASYEHHPSDTATNTYYKWRSDGDRMLDYDAHSDPFNFLYEQQSSGHKSRAQERPSSLGSNSSGSFDSSTYRKSKTPTHLREQLEQLKTQSNDDLLEEDEREKYKTVTLSSFRKSFRDRLLQQQKEAPHNPAWFVEVPPPPATANGSGTTSRGESKENRPDFLVFDNENYRPQSRSPLRDRPSRSVTRSPVKRNETFRVAHPTVRHLSPSPTPPAASSIRIEIKNSILPHSPGRLVPVGVAKPMPTTEYYAQRLLANSLARQTPPQQQSSGKWHRSPTRLTGISQLQSSSAPQRSSGRYQTTVHIGSESSKLTATPTALPARGRAPTRVQLYGSKPSNRQQHQQLQQPSATYFGGHYNAPATSTAINTVSKPLANSRASVGNASANWGRRVEQPSPRVVAPAQRRNRSPIKIPWR
ncbi:zinc finger CCCH domain-containing protein 13 [Drosophila albomicans]|uniref:Zinc finger CCCH domain-containing protein 13 n=1 Tax=Drosophila albomicans TaxID=7291 RepID=A0A6P8X914_DROAB|nr:zinc finger CCCH domain-containing protein 13 [Drosophila albomicans]